MEYLYGGDIKLYSITLSVIFLWFVFIGISSSVSILSKKLNLFLVSIFAVDGLTPSVVPVQMMIGHDPF